MEQEKRVILGGLKLKGVPKFIAAFNGSAVNNGVSVEKIEWGDDGKAVVTIGDKGLFDISDAQDIVLAKYSADLSAHLD